MDKAKFESFAKLMVMLSEYYKDSVTEAGLMVWADALGDYPIEAIERGMLDHIGDTQYIFHKMPMAAHIKKMIERRMEEQVAGALLQVTDAIGCIGMYQSASFSDAKISASIHTLGGWIKRCQMAESDVPAWNRDFARHYLSYAKNPLPQIPNTLPGLIEKQNTAIGVSAPDHVTIGYSSGRAAIPRLSLKRGVVKLVQENAPHV